jgi:hypothetical protein
LYFCFGLAIEADSIFVGLFSPHKDAKYKELFIINHDTYHYHCFLQTAAPKAKHVIICATTMKLLMHKGVVMYLFWPQCGMHRSLVLLTQVASKKSYSGSLHAHKADSEQHSKSFF